MDKFRQGVYTVERKADSPGHNIWLVRKILKRHNLPHISIHSLRHTNATLLIAGGADLRTVSKRLGHADMTTTANIYTHAIQSADERAAQVLDAMLPVNNAKAN